MANNNDDFKNRVDKIFGSLSSSTPAWSLTGEEIQKKEWLKKFKHDSDDEEDDNENVSNTKTLSSKGNCFSGDVMIGKKKKKIDDFDGNMDEDDDDEEEEEEEEDEEEDIRVSIGLDPTLDFEAEEDEYDKVAEGRENEGERLYMSNVTDHGPYLNSHNVLPDSVQDTTKDSRANHFAAKARLEEDQAESFKFPDPLSRKISEGKKPKPVLKSRDNSSSSKEQRRVRFDPYCKKTTEEGKSENMSTNTPALQTTASDYHAWVRNSPAVPDYVMNPSKYTRYSFDSTSEIENMELLKPVNPSNVDEVPLDLPKFTPRKKESGPIPMVSVSENKEEVDTKHLGFTRGIPAVEEQPSDDMDVEDEQDVKQAEAITTENKKPSRRYRPRPKGDALHDFA